LHDSPSLLKAHPARDQFRGRSAGATEGTWEPFDGTQDVIVGDLSETSDGDQVKVDTGQ
jgi:hypothetical protein